MATAAYTIDAEVHAECSVAAAAVVDDLEVPSASAGKTILDLNEDCWRTILDYIPEGDIARSERVSRCWQAVVYRYFRDAGVCFIPFSSYFKHYDAKILRKNRVFLINFRNIYNHSEVEDVLEFLDKWGPCIVHTLCPTMDVFGKITESCPNLKSLAITMNSFRNSHLSEEQADFVEKLERIIFMDFTADDYIGMKSTAGRKIFDRFNILFRDSNLFEGFWPNYRPINLKSLTVRGIFDFRYFLSAVECFPELTDLNLQADLKNVRCLLEKTPKLDRLCIMEWIMDDEEPPGNTCKPMCGLQTLRHVILWRSHVRGWWLNTVLESTSNLQILDLTETGLPIQASELCQRVGPTLTALRLQRVQSIRDSHVATLFEGCPKLNALDIQDCHQISDDLWHVIEPSVRGREQLLMLVSGTIAGHWYSNYSCYGEFPGLVVTHDDSIRSPPRQYIPRTHYSYLNYLH